MTETALTVSLPEALREIRTRPLFTMRLTAGDMLDVGQTPAAARRVGLVTGGRFEGERLSGKVLGGGSDWQTLGADGATQIDVRLHLKAGDGTLIMMRYRGLRHGPPEVMSRLAVGEIAFPVDYYFRIAATLETASSAHGWLNRILAIGTGHRYPSGPIYNLFEVL